MLQKSSFFAQDMVRRWSYQLDTGFGMPRWPNMKIAQFEEVPNATKLPEL